MAQPQRWWRPTSDADLLLAAQAGTLSENTPHLELKQEIETGAAANRELGRDLASFGVTGGSVFVPRSANAVRVFAMDGVLAFDLGSSCVRAGPRRCPLARILREGESFG